MGTVSTYLDYCAVGSSSSSPKNSDTTIGSLIAYTNTTFTSNVIAFSGAEPYYTYTRRSFTFGTGGAVGNISEVTIGGSTNGTNIFSRALILDGNGNPTTITVLSDETLYVTYELRTYPPTDQFTGSVVLDGVTYNYVAMSCNIDSIAYWQIPPASSGERNFSSAYTNGCTGSIIDILSIPSGNSYSATSISVSTYVNGYFYVDHTVVFGLTAGNDASGLKTIYVRQGSTTFQYEFTPAIPKTHDKILTLVFRHSWGRA